MKSLSLTIIDGLGTETEQYENIAQYVLNNFKKIPITEVLFLTPNKDYKNPSFNVKYINKLDYCDLNELMFQGLVSYSNTDKFMVIQTDGLPLNQHHWDDEFLNYDYIGAPWPAGMRWTGNSPLVGNGGFSIRSRQLYGITRAFSGFRDFHLQTLTNEDVAISLVVRKMLEENGIKFAPVELAKKFSIEIPISEDHTLESCFGFHGKKYIEILKDKKHELFSS
jgi:hypothetical protein